MVAWVHGEGRIQGQRAYQEDDYGVFELPPNLGAGDVLLVLADGMGGERAGDQASAAAVRSFIDAYAAIPVSNIPQRLRRSLDHANRELALEIESAPHLLSGMGCTLLAVALTPEGLYWVSVGDSPLWLWRDGQLTRLNQDQSFRSVLAQQVAAGAISQEEADNHPDRNALLSALTGESLTMVDLQWEPYPAQTGDRVLLASDGLLTLSDDEIAAQLAGSAEEPGTVCQGLLAAVVAVANPLQDNTTVLLAQAGAQPQRSGGGRWVLLLSLLTGVVAGLGWLWQHRRWIWPAAATAGMPVTAMTDEGQPSPRPMGEV